LGPHTPDDTREFQTGTEGIGSFGCSIQTESNTDIGKIDSTCLDFNLNFRRPRVFKGSIVEVEALVASGFSMTIFLQGVGMLKKVFPKRIGSPFSDFIGEL